MRREIAALFPPGVSGSESSDFAEAEDLYPEEQPAVARAVEKRRREFALGRTCARRALRKLGLAGSALPANPDRSVAWPDGVLGSISHTDDLCLAVCAKRDVVKGLGVDVERRRRVGRSLWPQIAGPRELQWLGAQPADTASTLGTVLFSAKEAFYKAQYCVTQTFLGFHDVELRLVEPTTFEIELRTGAGPLPAGARFRGRIALLEAHVVTALVLTQAGAG